ncbi:MAG: hypothetical protein ACR2L2_06485 [Acidobacteriota bacterium]
MENLDELARAVKEKDRPPVPVVEYRTPQPRRRGPIHLDPPVLARFVGWSLTAFGALQAIIGALLMVAAIVSLLNRSSFSGGAAVASSLMAPGFFAGALAITALGQILLLLAELVEQGRRREKS